MTKRTLRLHRETLTELTCDDLRDVVGAQNQSGLTCPVGDCISQLFQTCRCATGNC